MLKCKKKLVIEVDYRDLERFIAEEYGLDEFCAIEESPNDSTHQYNVSKEEIDEYNQKRIDKIIKHKSSAHWELGVILIDLCNKDKLEEGDYIMEVCW